MAEAVAVEKVVPRISYVDLAKARSKLRSLMRQFWDSIEGQMIAVELSRMAHELAIDKKYSEIAKATGYADALKRYAEEVDLSYGYKRVWGKG
jgi:hypothetical protein